IGRARCAPARSAGISARATAARPAPRRGAAGFAWFRASAAVQQRSAAEPVPAAAVAGTGSAAGGHRRGEQRAHSGGGAQRRLCTDRTRILGAGRRLAGCRGALSSEFHAPLLRTQAYGLLACGHERSRSARRQTENTRRGGSRFVAVPPTD